MMTTVILRGVLGRKHGRQFKFDITYNGQVISALEAARPGFRDAVSRMTKYRFVVKTDKKPNGIKGSELSLPCNTKTIEIIPILEGASSSKGIWETIAGVVLIAAGITLDILSEGALSPIMTYVIGLGISLTLGGIAQLIAGTPSQASTAATKNKASYIFNGAENTMEQGGPVKLPYGDIMAGSSVLSVDIVSADITAGSNNTGSGGSTATNPGDPSNNTGTSLRTNRGGGGGPAFWRGPILEV